jgi:WD40 repeat protein
MDEAEGMIVALQYPPGEYRNDGKMFGQMYEYNHLVTGLPQLQIETLLASRSNNALLGKVVMTLGLELRRAYVNALAVLSSTGTLVSAHDDGHLQLWEHGEMVRDVVHEGVVQEGGGGVDCLVSLAATGSPNSPAAFASGGRGCIRLWTDEGECLGVLTTPPGSSPSSMGSIPIMPNGILCLAACLKITRQSNPNQFRLLPQDEEGRRRRAEAQARERAIGESLARVSQSVWVWSWPHMQPVALESHDDSAAAITALAVLSGDHQDDAVLISGDAMGGLRFWRGHPNLSSSSSSSSSSQVEWEQWKLLQLRPADAVVSVVCMESLPGRRLAVSTERSSSAGALSLVAGSVGLDAPFCNAIYILNTDSNFVQQTLTGHQDAVICMCALPDGGLATGGGKMDATVRVWDGSQLSGSEERVLSESAATLDEVGYVFSLAVLPDSKPPGSQQHYALAAARYNVVKICL